VTHPLLPTDGPDQVTIAPPKPAMFISSAANFSLTCASGSSPAATYTWYRDQQLMKATGPTLSLEVIKGHKFQSQVGAFMCKAKNAKTNREVASVPVSFAVMGE